MRLNDVSPAEWDRVTKTGLEHWAREVATVG